MPSPIALKDIAPMRGKKLVDAQGKTLGRIEAIHYDGLTKEVFWFEVKRGLLNQRRYLVPGEGARIDGRVVVSAFDKDKVVSGPEFDMWKGLTDEVDRRANEYFGTDQPKRLRVMQVMREGDFVAGLP